MYQISLNKSITYYPCCSGKTADENKSALKKLKRGDVVSIDWIDAGDLDDSPSSWFSQEDAEKVFKEIPVQTIAVYFGHGKENLFLVRDTEKFDEKSPYYNGACCIPIGCIRSVEKLSN